MAMWTNYWRIITPASRKQEYTELKTDSLDPRGYGNGGAVAAISWYSQIMKGAGSRLQRYIQYDSMDNDVDVARALDVIAEEMSGDDERTGLPFMIDYQTEENQEVNETTVTTIRAAVRHWANLQDFNNRIFRIARTLAKYGDCFFKKNSDTKKWEYVDVSDVVGIEVNDQGEKIAFHLKGSGANATFAGRRDANVDVVPAAGIIHFSLSDDMGPSAPFGESVLQPVFRVFKQLSMLEDATIIYRIVRAPERRVFYIDVGNMPAQRVKSYLETIKNDIRQKRVPNTSGKETVDGTYNPQSISEDFFFPVTTSGRGSRVETLPGGTMAGDTSELETFQAKIFRGLRVPTSYMSGSAAGGAQVTDGKVGIAYIEELRFANYIKRLQNKIESIMDEQFKTYLDVTGVKIDPELFKLKLPDPQNFALYRQAALDADLITAFKSIEDVKYLSKRWIMKRYLGLTEDEIQMNESMIKQEHGIRDDTNVPDLQQIYDDGVYENRPKVEVEVPEDPEAEGGSSDQGGGDESGGEGPTDAGGGEEAPAGPEAGGEEEVPGDLNL